MNPQYAYEACFYAFQLTLTANQKLNNQRVPIDLDSDFVLTGIHGTSTGTFTVNFKLPSGRSFANNPVQNTNLIGTANQPTAIGPSPVYPRSTNGPLLDLVDTSAGNNTLEIIFSGLRRYVAQPS